MSKLETMASPATLATEATPLEVSKKRKHDEIEEVLKKDNLPTAATDGAKVTMDDLPDHIAPTRRIEDSDDEEDDDKSAFEAILDHFEGHPYVDDGSIGIDDGGKKHLRRRLQQIGPDKFFEETILAGMDPRVLGAAFNLDPNVFTDMDDEEDDSDQHHEHDGSCQHDGHDTHDAHDDRFLRLLSHAIMRAYYKRPKLPQYNTIDDVAKLLRQSSNIMVITGAGISTSLGIPDFRSKHTGFYSKIAEMGYSEPEEVFDIHNFDEDPSIFYSLAGDILPDHKRVSRTHSFIRLLQDKGKLQTNYSQNIDDLESLAGIHPDRLIQCHGSFATAVCRKCKHTVPGTEIFPDIRAKKVPICPRCVESLQAASLQATSRPIKKSRSNHNSDNDDDDDQDDDIPTPGVLKPSITFFGEPLPATFFTRFTTTDAPTTDLVLILGTSLQVAPVSDMPNCLPRTVPVVYVSREKLRHVEVDVQLLGDCDTVCEELGRRCGWEIGASEAGEVVGKARAHVDSRGDVEVVERVGEDGVGEGHIWEVRRKQVEEGGIGVKEGLE